MPRKINSKVEGAVPVELSTPLTGSVIEHLTSMVSCETKPNNDAASPTHE
jgi:hypothetical protein